MLRCECQARLGRGWRFCESCGRPVALPGGQSLPETSPNATATTPEPDPSDAASAVRGRTDSSPQPVDSPKIPAQSADQLDWRFGIIPVLLGALLSLSLAWLSLWAILAGALLGALWALNRWRKIRLALDEFKADAIFEKVLIYGPCALSTRALWPSGVLYLTDQTLKFKPFNHTNEREVSLDPVRLAGADSIQRLVWPPHWRCLQVTSNYGPVFGTMKVFDVTIWQLHLNAARLRALLPTSQESV
jgi:hypothetical protein